MSRLLISTAAAALLSGAALAADLPMLEVPPAAEVVASYDWTGFYFGGHGGGAWGESEIDITVDGLGFMFPPGSEYDIEGAFAGGQVGYDVQMGRWVLGVAADGSWTDIDGFQQQSGDDGYETDLNWIGSVRARAGVAFGRFLPYVTGGFAFGEMESTVGDTDGAGNFDPIANGGAGIASGSEIATGWTAGGGVEVGLFSRLSIGAEYRYTDIDADFNETTDSGFNEQWDADARFHSVRGTVNVRF